MDISAELQLHRFDVLQSGATAKGSLRVGRNCRPLFFADQTDHLQLVAGVAARPEQTAKGCTWGLCRSAAMHFSQEGRYQRGLQDLTYRTQSVLRDTWQGPNQSKRQDLRCTGSNSASMQHPLLHASKQQASPDTDNLAFVRYKASPKRESSFTISIPTWLRAYQRFMSETIASG